MLYRVGPLLYLAVAGVLPAVAANPPGIKNFDQVDAHVYRGGQPTDEGLRYLARIGVKTVIDLREPGTRATAEERIARELGMAYINVPMTGLMPPTEAELLRILPVLENASEGPVFVHCMRGADRTGAVIAAYHIDHHHWDNSRALEDAKAHHMAFFQLPRQNFIRAFQPLTMAKGAGDIDASATAPAIITPVANSTVH